MLSPEKILLLSVLCIGIGAISIYITLTTPKVIIFIMFSLRPLMFWENSINIAGINMFELFAAYMNLLLVLGMLVIMLTRKAVFFDDSVKRISLAFIIWCLSIVAIIPSSSLVGVSRYILPIFDFIVICNLIKSKKDMETLLICTYCCYIIPIVCSSLLILSGMSIGKTIYWTGLARYQGIYANIHNMAHSMTLYFFIALTYFHIRDFKSTRGKNFFIILTAIITLLALYCLLKSYVRTAFVALFLMMIVYLKYYSKILLSLFIMLTIVIGSINYDKIMVVFFDVADAVGHEESIEKAGSGRPQIWKYNIDILNQGGIVAWIAGVGFRGGSSGSQYFSSINSHNDYLDLVMQSGLVGLLLYIILTVLLYKRSFKLPNRYRGIFQGILVYAVTANMLSNSLIDRFGLAQLFFMLMGIMVNLTQLDMISPKNNPLNPKQA